MLHSADEEVGVQNPPRVENSTEASPVQMGRPGLCLQWDPSLWLPKPGPARNRSMLHSAPSQRSWGSPPAGPLPSVPAPPGVRGLSEACSHHASALPEQPGSLPVRPLKPHIQAGYPPASALNSVTLQVRLSPLLPTDGLLDPVHDPAQARAGQAPDFQDAVSATRSPVGTWGTSSFSSVKFLVCPRDIGSAEPSHSHSRS